MLYALLKPLAVALMRGLFGLRGRGAEHVPRQGPVLLVANHSSLLDPPMVGGMAPRPLWFLAKAELFAVPLLGGFIRRLNARPVRREGSDAGALRTSLRVLAEGGALLVFPEGTRGAEGQVRPFKAGAGMLAVLSGAPVVPVYVSGSGRAWPRGRWLPRPAKVMVTFGAPLRFTADAGAGKKEQYEAAARALQAAVAGLSETAAPPAGRPSPATGVERSAGRA
ncbi:MAG TPA: lysophospholipid acyltransferase family protein [Methylomirabilota bacterium]|nr:lysophospholipid acyltransferase family protein [Methylomirabilota bacterium]